MGDLYLVQYICPECGATAWASTTCEEKPILDGIPPLQFCRACQRVFAATVTTVAKDSVADPDSRPDSPKKYTARVYQWPKARLNAASMQKLCIALQVLSLRALHRVVGVRVSHQRLSTSTGRL